MKDKRAGKDRIRVLEAQGRRRRRRGEKETQNILSSQEIGNLTYGLTSLLNLSRGGCGEKDGGRQHAETREHEISIDFPTQSTTTSTRPARTHACTCANIHP